MFFEHFRIVDVPLPSITQIYSLVFLQRHLANRCASLNLANGLERNGKYPFELATTLKFCISNTFMGSILSTSISEEEEEGNAVVKFTYCQSIQYKHKLTFLHRLRITTNNFDRL